MKQFLAAAAAVLLTAPAFGMTIDQAYQEMSHRHANLDLASAGFTRDEAAYLGKIFQLVDLAIVEKMQTYTWFQSEGKKGASFRDYKGRVDVLIAQLEGVPAPARIGAIHRLLIEAIRDQRAFFEAWQQALDVGQQGQDNAPAYQSRGRYLKTSSDKLHEVYNNLRALFPNAGQQNFDAFYDHLCVLDLL